VLNQEIVPSEEPCGRGWMTTLSFEVSANSEDTIVLHHDEEKDETRAVNGTGCHCGNKCSSRFWCGLRLICTRLWLCTENCSMGVRATELPSKSLVRPTALYFDLSGVPIKVHHGCCTFQSLLYEQICSQQGHDESCHCQHWLLRPSPVGSRYQIDR
jgi:hypothetical protein